MRIVDLSHPVTASMPLWPGTPQPRFSDLHTIGRDGFAERWLQLSSHTGTHIDAPAHIIEGATTLERFDAERFFGEGLLLDLRELRHDTITLEALLEFRAQIGDAEFLLLHTGWSRFWGTEEYDRAYPVLSAEAAEWLAGLRLKGIGIDAPSFDTATSESYPVHRCLLGAGLVLIENLAALEQFGEGCHSGFFLSILPLNITGAEACPVRAVAIWPP
jgi:arylformamidase